MFRFIIKNDETILSGTNGNFNIDFTQYYLPSPTGRYKLTLENVSISSPLNKNYRYITCDLISNSISNIGGAFNILCVILINNDEILNNKGSLNNSIKYDINNFNKIVNFKIYSEDGAIDNDAVCVLEFSIKSINK